MFQLPAVGFKGEKNWVNIGCIIGFSFQQWDLKIMIKSGHSLILSRFSFQQWDLKPSAVLYRKGKHVGFSFQQWDLKFYTPEYVSDNVKFQLPAVGFKVLSL